MTKVVRYSLIFLFIPFCVLLSQNENELTGTIIDSNTSLGIKNVHILNLGTVIGSISGKNGEFKIPAQKLDKILFSHLGYETLKIEVTEDLLGSETVKFHMIIKSIPIEEIEIRKHKLTGIIEIDTKLIPIENPTLIRIDGLPNVYEVGSKTPSGLGRVLSAVNNPVDFLYNMFSKKSKSLKKLKKLEKDSQLRDYLQSKYDRELVLELLQISRDELNNLIRFCNYSDYFIKTSSDFQLVVALSGCYNKYKAIKDGKTK